MASWFRWIFGAKGKPARSTDRRRGYRPQLEALENRLLMSATPALLLHLPPPSPGLVVNVTNDQDSGSGSLRQAIETINNDSIFFRSSPDEIVFNNGGKVFVSESLTALTRGDVIIDGTNKATGRDETLQGPGSPQVQGLTINGAYTTVENLLVTGFNIGILLTGGGDDAIEHNTVSGNLGFGIGDVSNGNTLQDNFIGTDATGTKALPNAIGVQLGGNGNCVLGNTISGNDTGIGVLGNSNILQGNFIGTDHTGSVAVPNGGKGQDAGGLVIVGSDNTIGGTTAQERNVISGNGQYDIAISGDAALDLQQPGPTGNLIEGNYIGTSTKGNAILNPNGITTFGVYSDGNASGNTIGGTAAGEGNVISGATTAAIDINNQIEPQFGPPAAGDTRIAGNLINTDRTGTVKLYSGGVGIELFDTSVNTISANVIAVGPGAGILIQGSSVAGQPAFNEVEGNFIGTAANGKTDLGNSSAGIGVQLTGTAGNSIDNNTFGFLDVGIDGISNNNDSGNSFIHVKTDTE